MKKVIKGLLVLVGLSVGAGQVFAATSATANLTFAVQAATGITVNATYLPSGSGTVVLSAPWDANITGANWTAKLPIVVDISYATNEGNKLTAYIKHDNDTGFSAVSANIQAAGAGSRPDGLLNVTGLTGAGITSANVAARIIPLRAYIDVSGTSSVTTANVSGVNVVTAATTSAIDGDWGCWVLDSTFTTGLTSTKQTLLDSTGAATGGANKKVYIRQSWTSGKIAGSYAGTLYFDISAQ